MKMRKNVMQRTDCRKNNFNAWLRLEHLLHFLRQFTTNLDSWRPPASTGHLLHLRTRYRNEWFRSRRWARHSVVARRMFESVCEENCILVFLGWENVKWKVNTDCGLVRQISLQTVTQKNCFSPGILAGVDRVRHLLLSSLLCNHSWRVEIKRM